MARGFQLPVSTRESAQHLIAESVWSDPLYVCDRDGAQSGGDQEATPTELCDCPLGDCGPFILGAILAVFLYEEYSGADATVLTFALFVGITLSVTAFPVLARIIQEQGKMQSRLGILYGECGEWRYYGVVPTSGNHGNCTGWVGT